jgi:hypothetical protein
MQRPSLKSGGEAASVEVSQGGGRGHRSSWGRMRSGALLVALLVGIGVGAAALIGVLALAMAALLDQAL